MARTPLARLLQQATAEVAASNARHVSRRDALKLGGALGLAAAAAAVPVPARAATSSRRIAVVGGGLAGLACAYQLKQAGQSATVYEASDRVGGRSWTYGGRLPTGSWSSAAAS